LDPIAGELFELELTLPDDVVHARGKHLIGFEARYERIRRDMRLLSASDEVRRWSKQFYGRELPLCELIAIRFSFSLVTSVPERLRPRKRPATDWRVNRDALPCFSN
jgi:hypothetical protein